MHASSVKSADQVCKQRTEATDLEIVELGVGVVGLQQFVAEDGGLRADALAHHPRRLDHARNELEPT